MKRILMVLSVMALVVAFTSATLSAQNAPKAKSETTTEKVVTEKSEKAPCTTEKKDGKACCSSAKTESAKAACATPCPSEKAKACGSKGSHTDAAKPVPASDNK